MKTQKEKYFDWIDAEVRGRGVWSRIAGHRDDSGLWTWVTVLITVPILIISVVLMPLWVPFFWMLDCLVERDSK